LIEPLDRPRLYRLLRRYLGEDQQAWNPSFRARVIDRLELMVRIQRRGPRRAGALQGVLEVLASRQVGTIFLLDMFFGAAVPTSATIATVPLKRAARITGPRSTSE
jgi:hypothetical protein